MALLIDFVVWNPSVTGCRVRQFADCAEDYSQSFTHAMFEAISCPGEISCWYGQLHINRTAAGKHKVAGFNPYQVR